MRISKTIGRLIGVLALAALCAGPAEAKDRPVDGLEPFEVPGDDRNFDDPVRVPVLPVEPVQRQGMLETTDGSVYQLKRGGDAGFLIDELISDHNLETADPYTIATQGSLEAKSLTKRRRERSIGKASRKAFKWHWRDRSGKYWEPAGITGSADADAQGNLLLVSWNSRSKTKLNGSSTPNRGVRVSFVDIGDMDEITYEHVLLVEPDIKSADDTSFKVIMGEFYGLAWYKNHLFLARSDEILVFDMTKILRARGEGDKVGRSGSTLFAFDNKYMLPMVTRYRVNTDESTTLHLSHLSVDRSVEPHALVARGWTGSPGERLLRFDLDSGTGLLVPDVDAENPDEDRFSTPSEAFKINTPIYNFDTRGVATEKYSGRAWIGSRSYDNGKLVGRFHRTGTGLNPPTGSDSFDQAPLDLYHDSTNRLLWSLTGRRFVFCASSN